MRDIHKASHSATQFTALGYDFRDVEFFKLKILGIHETKYALVG